MMFAAQHENAHEEHADLGFFLASFATFVEEIFKPRRNEAV